MNDSGKTQIDHPEDFYFFDSLKIASQVRKMRTDIEKLRFFESLKMEFDNGSSYCKHHIKRILNSRAYVEKFKPLCDPSLSDETKDLYDDLEHFMKERLSQNKLSSWSFYFTNADDYMFFISNLANFFYGKEHNSKRPVSIKKNSYVCFYRAVHDIYFYCSPNKKMAQDKKFLLLMKTLNCFEKLSFHQIYYKLLHH